MPTVTTMNGLPPLALFAIGLLFSACFLGATNSLSPSPALSITDAMLKTATAETERLYKYYHYQNNSNSNSNRNETELSRASIETPPTVWLSREKASSYVRDNIDTVLFDCDGVLYRTKTPCPGASECISGLLKDGKNVLFVTNNAGVNRNELRSKLSNLLGIDSLRTDQMVSSSYASAKYLERKLPERARVHVIGSSGLCQELAVSGFEVSGGPSLLPDATAAAATTTTHGSMSREELGAYDFGDLHPIDALVVGHDTDLNFRKLCIADNLLLKNPGALFVATNKDSFDVVDGKSEVRHILGNGATVAALEYSSNRRAIDVGKPSKELFELIARAEKSLDPSRCLFVGDRLDTDIRFGKDNGMKSLLVMTGVTNAKTLEDLANGTEEEPLPDFVLPCVGMLVR